MPEDKIERLYLATPYILRPESKRFKIRYGRLSQLDESSNLQSAFFTRLADLAAKYILILPDTWEEVPPGEGSNLDTRRFSYICLNPFCGSRHHELISYQQLSNARYTKGPWMPPCMSGIIASNIARRYVFDVQDYLNEKDLKRGGFGHFIFQQELLTSFGEFPFPFSKKVDGFCPQVDSNRPHSGVIVEFHGGQAHQFGLYFRTPNQLLTDTEKTDGVIIEAMCAQREDRSIMQDNRRVWSDEQIIAAQSPSMKAWFFKHDPAQKAPNASIQIPIIEHFIIIFEGLIRPHRVIDLTWKYKYDNFPGVTVYYELGSNLQRSDAAILQHPEAFYIPHPDFSAMVPGTLLSEETVATFSKADAFAQLDTGRQQTFLHFRDFDSPENRKKRASLANTRFKITDRHIKRNLQLSALSLGGERGGCALRHYDPTWWRPQIAATENIIPSQVVMGDILSWSVEKIRHYLYFQSENGLRVFIQAVGEFLQLDESSRNPSISNEKLTTYLGTASFLMKERPTRVSDQTLDLAQDPNFLPGSKNRRFWLLYHSWLKLKLQYLWDLSNEEKNLILFDLNDYFNHPSYSTSFDQKAFNEMYPIVEKYLIDYELLPASEPVPSEAVIAEAAPASEVGVDEFPENIPSSRPAERLDQPLPSGFAAPEGRPLPEGGEETLSRENLESSKTALVPKTRSNIDQSKNFYFDE